MAVLFFCGGFMENSYLYKSRVSLFDLDILIWLVVCVFGFFLSPIIGVLAVLVLLFWVVNTVGMRIYVYEDKLEYKAGFILKVSSKTLLLKNVSSISYSTDLIGRIFNYGDVVVSTYSETAGISIKKVKNAKMLVENINELLRNKIK